MTKTKMTKTASFAPQPTASTTVEKVENARTLVAQKTMHNEGKPITSNHGMTKPS